MLAGLLMLTGCAAVMPAPEAPIYRDPGAVLAGSTRFDADRMAGRWVARACIGPCAPAVTFTVSQTGAVTETAADGTARTYVATGPGILRSPDGAETLVVMWVDEDFRTAALGSATGSHARILDRAPEGGADRIEAARRMLDFNGWDTGQLRTMQ